MTATPRWLDCKWKSTGQDRQWKYERRRTGNERRDGQWKDAGVPQSLLTGSLEERATLILAMVKNGQRELEEIKPNLPAVLALDLAAAAAEQRKWPQAVEALLVRVLGLQEGHKAGRWYGFELEGRGRKPKDIDAWFTAMVFDDFCYEKYGKVLNPRALARKLQDRGFNTKPASIREWRKESYDVKPGTPGYVPPNADKMTAEEERQVPPLAPHRGPSAS